MLAFIAKLRRNNRPEMQGEWKNGEGLVGESGPWREGFVQSLLHSFPLLQGTQRVAGGGGGHINDGRKY